ncbi:MAG: uroporphyrinogen-III synthase [Promicromonosporaceae bacterium]|nr:uroporphyrinogen-III synthase [Promicromonosporaceae bacterium]
MTTPGLGRLLAQRRPDHALAAAVTAAGGLLDEVDFVIRHNLPAADLQAQWAQLTARFAQAGPPQWVVITSPHTVAALLGAAIDLRELLTSGTRLATVGAASTAACLAVGWPVALQPPPPLGGGAALAAVFPAGSGEVLIPGALVSAGTLEPHLAALGWAVSPLPVYATSPAEALGEVTVDRWRAGEYQALLATSPSVVRAAAQLLGVRRGTSSAAARPPVSSAGRSAAERGSRATETPCVVIGRTTESAARLAGFPVVVADSPTPQAIIAAVATLLPEGHGRFPS